MGQRMARLGPLMAALVMGVAATWCGRAAGQDVLHVFGAEGPASAIQEAAGVFGERNGIRVEVVTGPPDQWLDRAANEADVVFASAEFMMGNFLRNEALQVDESSITPLYLRPSAVLVRPGNPKNIRDFPDLLKPGMRVMVVSGSGQTGLWEDMAGRQGDIRMVGAFRKNIAVFAPTSTDAMRLWDERPDIDAYVTWNIWHIPLRDRATLIALSKEWTVYRQCSAALTRRGTKKPPAERFIAFLVAPEGAKIFESWNWMPVPSERNELAVTKGNVVVCRIDNDERRGDVGAGLADLRDLVNTYRAKGMSPGELHVTAVVLGNAGYWLLKDEAYNAATGGKGPNPNKPLIQELQDLGVSLELCGETMKVRGWTTDDVLPGVRIVPNGSPRIVDLELQGYAYIRF